MAIKNKFIHFKTRAAFDVNVPNPTSTADDGNQFYNYTTFIQDTKEIYTHGTFYKCNISEEEVEALIASKGYITEDDIPVLSGGAAATSGQYVSGVTVSGHTVTVTKAALPSAATIAPKASGTAAVGTSTKYAREDHVHPLQTNVATATKLATPRVIAIAGAISGSATFDGSSNVSINSTLNGFDASKITSGTLNADRLPEIPISKIPAAAMERLYVVESQSAAMSLTIQEGDVIQIGSGGPMYFCVSESASTFATKFKVFTAGAATSVPWSGVTNAPTKLSQFSNDAGYLTSVPAQTWASITGKPSTFTPSAHTQSYTTLTGSTTTANQAIVSNGTANGWTLKTLGSNAFNSTSYIPTSVSVVASTLAAGSSATASYDASTNKFTFGIPRGATGATGPAGAAAGFDTPTVDNSAAGNVGTPSVTITATGANTSKVFNFKFSNLKGATGSQGPKGDKGDKGDTGATGPAGTYTAGSGISISGNTISAEIPVALPNPYALTINGQSYTGSSSVNITTSKPLTSGGNTSGTVVAGRNYSATSSIISSVSGFSYDNPDAVVGSSTKITSFPSSVKKMDGIADLSGSFYVYCFSYVGGRVCVNGAVYA